MTQTDLDASRIVNQARADGICEDGDGTYELTPAIAVVSVFLVALVCLAILAGR